jgi:serine/threonine protein kinase
MTIPHQWTRVKEIVGDALECETGERIALLDRVCAENEQLREEVESLIAAYEEAAPLSRCGCGGSRHGSFRENVAADWMIGPYRLERELGAGGMGQVWLAEQTEPVRRHVALKLIRTDFHDRPTARRFLAERQSLALMNHPAIARVFDAGTTELGQPYLVMEYVDGCPITEYCDRHRLTIAERLRLFEQVCEGVQHAHQKAIIHRDLKPSNILVTEVDGQPLPRIIDFGVAKSIARDLDPEATFTQAGSVIGTVGYMSPEQADGNCGDVDTRSDVYSLGVVLFELLTGKLPIDQGSDSSYFEALRCLREQEAPRPSSKVRALGNSSVIAAARGTTPDALGRQLRGDADSIVLRALEKDRNLRYGSPAELRADIRRYLRDQPVSARAANVQYLAGKYVRRHRVGVLGALAAVLLLVGFAVAQTMQLRDTRRQRDRADRITDFMTNMYKVSDPSEARGNSVTAREILDQSARQIETNLRSDSTVQSQLMQVMAKTYMGLGLYDRAYDLALQALNARRRTLGPHNPQVLESMTELAEIMDHQGRDQEAEALMRKTIDLEVNVLGPQDSLTLEARQDLAHILASHGHYVEAESMERAMLAIETRTLGPDNLQTFRSLNTLAQVLSGESRFEEAGEVLREALDKERQTLGPDHPLALRTLQSLADLRDAQSRHDEAEALDREELAIQRRVLGPEHPEVGATTANLATTVSMNPNRQMEAEALYRQALDIEQRAVGPDHGYTTRAKEGLANLLSSNDHYPEAKALYEQVLASRMHTLGPDNTDTLLTEYNFSFVLFDEKHYVEAEKLLRKTLAAQERVLDRDDPDTLASEAELARVLVYEGKPEEAERLARHAYLVQLQRLGFQHDDTKDTLTYLGKALVRLNRYSEAQGMYLETIDKVVASRAGHASDWWYDLADLSAFAGRNDDALNYLEHAVESGYASADNMRNDEDTKALRSDPRYKQALIAAQKNTAKKPTP